MKIIIFGTGNYVTGRGTKEFGTIIPAVFEFNKISKVSELLIIATKKASANKALKKIKKISKLSGQKIKTNIVFGKSIKSTLDNFKTDNNEIYCSIIATPDHTHFKITESCLKKNYNCLVVKPVVTKLKELNHLIKIANKNKLYAAVEFHKRFDRQAKLLRDKFNSNFIGSPLYTWTEYSQKKIVPENFFKSWVSKNNVFQYLGIHYVDLIRYITKATPIKALAIGQKNYLNKKKFLTEDSIQAIIKWKSLKGEIFSQTLLLNWIDPKFTTSMSDQKIYFVGTEGRVELNQKDRGVRTINEKNHQDDINPDFCKMYEEENGLISWNGYGIDSIKTFLLDLQKIKKKEINLKSIKKIRPSLEESRYSTAVLEAVNLSLKNNSSWKKIKL